MTRALIAFAIGALIIWLWPAVLFFGEYFVRAAGGY